MSRTLAHGISLFGPLLALGFLAGILRAVSLRATGRRRRLFGAFWVLTLLVGGPLWLFIAATLGL